MGRRQHTRVPEEPDSTPWAYGLVNLATYALGIGLVTLGGVLGARRRAPRTRGTVDLT
jgi:hypothetical protein